MYYICFPSFIAAYFVPNAATSSDDYIITVNPLLSHSHASSEPWFV